MQHYTFVAPCFHDRFADPTGPLAAWLLLMEDEFKRLLLAGHKPSEISVFGTTEKGGRINLLRFPSEASLRSQLTRLVLEVFEDPNLTLTFHSVRHVFYAKA